MKTLNFKEFPIFHANWGSCAYEYVQVISHWNENLFQKIIPMMNRLVWWNVAKSSSWCNWCCSPLFSTDEIWWKTSTSRLFPSFSHLSSLFFSNFFLYSFHHIFTIAKWKKRSTYHVINFLNLSLTNIFLIGNLKKIPRR